MTHFVRPLFLARSLDPEEYEISFYAPERYQKYLGNERFVTGSLYSMAGEEFLARLARGAPLFPVEVLRRYVAEDRRILRSLRPDLAIGDMRLSLPVSARLENTTSAVMMNAYWSPYAKARLVLPELPLTRVVPPGWLMPLLGVAQPFVERAHTAAINSLRGEAGMEPVSSLRAMYTAGDWVLYPDVPEYVPTRGHPEQHCYIGTCPWTPSTPLPDWWDRMLADPRPRVFISLGSSGPLRALPALLRAARTLNVAVVLSSSGRAVADSAHPDLYSAELLPYTETAQRVQVVVSHGGSGGLYPALEAGTPVLAIPSNADQHLSSEILVESGAGLAVRVEQASERRIGDALERLLRHPSFAGTAREWSRVFSRYDSALMFRRFLAQVFEAPPQTR